MYFAVSGLSPVTITVFTPILRRRSKRSRMPVLMMSCSSITPRICSFSLTMSGVPPFSEMRRTVSSIPAGHLLPAWAAMRRIASDAPLRMRRPSGISTPEHLVSAVNCTICTPISCRGSTFMPISAPSSTTDLPSGVWSETDESTHRRVNSLTPYPCAGWNAVALRLPMVIVPVLSSSSVSMSPAVSTALPDLVMTLARRARSMPAMPMADSSPPMVVGIRQTNSEMKAAMVMFAPT